MKEMIFICFTPYQLMVSMYYAYKFRKIKKTLIFKDFADYHIDSSFYTKYFDNVFIIPYYEKKNIFIKQFYKCYYGGYLFSFSPIYKYLRNINYSIVIYFSDQEVSSNKIVLTLMKELTNYIILSEEGLGVYVNRECSIPLKTKIGNVICGLNTCNIIGESKCYHALFVKEPEIAHSRFLKDILIKQNDLFLDDNFINSIELPNIGLNNSRKKILILGEPTTEIGVNNNEYQNSLRRIINVYKYDYDIVIKPHPRDDVSIYDNLDDCVVLGNLKWVPAELLVLKYNFTKLISIYSASVMNVAKTNNSLKIFLTYPLYGLKIDNSLIEKFNKYSNIKSIDNYNDLLYDDCDKNIVSERKNYNYDLYFIETLIRRK